MIDKIIIRVAVLVLVVFGLLAVFYERPAVTGKRAAYLPAEGFVGDVTTGQRIFKQHCTTCHGQQLEGSDKGPSLLHPYYKPDHHGDISIYMAVYQGVHQHHWQFGNMPAQKQLTAEDAGHLLRYIRSEQKRAGLF